MTRYWAEQLETSRTCSCWAQLTLLNPMYSNDRLCISDGQQVALKLQLLSTAEHLFWSLFLTERICLKPLRVCYQGNDPRRSFCAPISSLSSRLKTKNEQKFGKLEVLDSEDADYPKASIPMSPVNNSQSPEFTTKCPINVQNGKLQVLGPKEELVIHPYEAGSRPGSAAGRQESAGRKSYIPTKQIPLCTVKPLAHSSSIPDFSAPSLQMSSLENSRSQETSSIPRGTDEKETTGPQSLAIQSGNIKGRLEESSDEDESDDETGRAPIELLAEFINAVMEEDYQVAQKLCQMILLYEPENPEAKQFSPLIEEMLKIEQQQSSEDEDSEDSDEETDEETDEGTSDTDDAEDHCTA
ncbi:glutamate-rich protein 2 [Leptodactylus fuscus]|uniref:glutamate-rich protein 2 n=1 Tax=Leptodactylus fuscus TaxID=238119 RepID=UPI003F4EE63F